MQHRNCRTVFAGAFLSVIGLVAQTSPDSGQWPFMNHDLNNTRSQPAQNRVGTTNVGSLSPKWTFSAGGDISVTPTVSGNAVYFPDWAGNLYAVDKNTGDLLWKHMVAEYNGVPGSVSRVSPAVHGNDLIFGDVENASATHNGASMMAVDQQKGTLRWITKVDTNPAAVITGSAVVFNDTVYVGVSSIEETLARNNSYACCTFRGSIVALDANTGAILWKTFVVPENGGVPGGYSGGAVWQPPAIDPSRGSLFIGTGNNYSVPASVMTCWQQNESAACTAPNDFFDTALSLDLQTGEIKWSKKFQNFDVWTLACLSAPPGTNCPAPSSPDFDFGGSGPNLLPNFVGFGQKSGIYWALNKDTGDVIWSSFVGPGGTLGGIEWGTATDGKRIYVAIANNGHHPYTLANNGPTITWGSWAALDVASGKIIWQIPDPTPGAIDTGSVTVANGVVYAGSYSGFMYGLDAATGAQLFSFQSGGSVIDGPSITSQFVYWGSGYAHVPPGTPNNKLFAFALP